MNGLSQMHEKVHGQWEKTLFTQHFHSLTESIDLTKPTMHLGTLWLSEAYICVSKLGHSRFG